MYRRIRASCLGKTRLVGDGGEERRGVYKGDD